MDALAPGRTGGRVEVDSSAVSSMGSLFTRSSAVARSHRASQRRVELRELFMSVRIEYSGDIAIVVTEGRFIRADQVDELEAALVTLLDHEQRNKILVDLSKMEFLRSISIGVIATAHGKALKRGAYLYLCGMNARNRSAFDLMKFGPQLAVFDTRDEAIAALRKL